TCTCATRRHPSAMTTSGPITQYGPIVTSLPISQPVAMRAVASIAVMGRASPICDHGTDFGLGHHLSVDLGLPTEPPHGLAARNLLHVVFERIAGDHRLAELGVVDGQEIDLLRPPILSRTRKDAHHARRLRHALDHQHTGKYRIAWKMTQKLGFVDG